MSPRTRDARAQRGGRALVVHVATVPWTLQFFRGQARYLRARGMDVQAVASPEPAHALTAFGQDEGVPVHALSMRREFAPLSDLVTLIRLWRLFRRLKPDIVHSHSPKSALLGTVAARLAGVPHVAISIFGLVQMARTGVSASVLNVLTRVQCRLADRVWCDSPSMRAHLASARLCPPHKITLIGSGSVNGVDAEAAFSPGVRDAWRDRTREELGIELDAVVIGYVGRITVDKGMRELATAWLELRREQPEAHLLMVGPIETGGRRPPEVDSVFAGDTRVHLIDETPLVPRYLAAMDIFALPSYREGFGIANIEAAAMELPVVATRIPGCTDSVVDGVTGTLVGVRDGAELAIALRRYVTDEALRAEHGEAGRRRVLAEFRPERIWAGLFEMYDSLLSAL